MTQACPKRRGILRQRLHEFMHDRVTKERTVSQSAVVRVLTLRCRHCNEPRAIVTVVRSGVAR